MNRTNIKNKRGGIGALLLVVFFILAFSALIIGIVKVFSDMEKKEQVEVSYVSEERVNHDNKQNELIENLQKSLEEAISDNDQLRNDIQQIKKEKEGVASQLAEKDSQISFLVSARTRLEESISETAQQNRIKEAQLLQDKEDLTNELDQEKARAEQALEKHEKTLSEQERQKQKLLSRIKVLEQEILSLQTNSLVVETSKMHFNLANHFIKNKEYRLAVSEYKRALRLTPDDFDANYNLALIYDIYTDEPAQALNYYKKCLEIEPEFSDKEIIQERIINLSLHDAVSIGDTLAESDDGHELHLSNVYYRE